MFDLRLKQRNRGAGRDGSAASTLSAVSRCSRGLTLIELLVVIAIFTTLVAGVVPLLSPNNVPRKIREAGRGLSTYIKLAQSKAARTGRPAGILLKKLSVDTRAPQDRGVCLEVFQVAVPPPYSGFSDSSTVLLTDEGIGPQGVRYYSATFGLGLGKRESFSASPAEILPPRMFKVGDILEVSGSRFLIADRVPYDPALETAPNGDRLDVEPFEDDTPFFTKVVRYNGTVYVHMDKTTGLKIDLVALDQDPNPLPPNGRPYRILRTPELTSEEPYQLPRGTCIDLQGSGLPVAQRPSCCHNPLINVTSGPGANTMDAALTNNDDGVIVMFDASGTVSQYFWNDANTQDPLARGILEETPITSQVYFLIGRRENVPVPITSVDGWNLANLSEDAREDLRDSINWLNPDSRWLAISSRSGNAIVAENAFLNLRSSRYSPQTVDLDGLMNSIPAQMADARQFAREMKREGGR